MNKEAKVIIASFMYFALVVERNEKMPEKLKKLYRKVGKISSMYQNQLTKCLEDLNIIIKDLDYEIDYLLASVTIIASYYEHMRGCKRLFTPISHNDILELQDELINDNDKLVGSTFDYCDVLVKRILNE